jgi:hypothetical protein
VTRRELEVVEEALMACLPMVTDVIDSPETGKKEKSSARVLHTKVTFSLEKIKTALASGAIG